MFGYVNPIGQGIGNEQNSILSGLYGGGLSMGNAVNCEMGLMGIEGQYLMDELQDGGGPLSSGQQNQLNSELQQLQGELGGYQNGCPCGETPQQWNPCQCDCNGCPAPPPPDSCGCDSTPAPAPPPPPPPPPPAPSGGGGGCG